MNTSDLIDLLVENNMNREKAKELVESSYAIALKKYNRSILSAEGYISTLYNIVENYYTTVKSYQFSKKNIMVETLIKEINGSFKENENSILKNEERINEFIRSIIGKERNLNSEENYAHILDSIVAFINCENKEKIFALMGEEQKTINELLAIDEIDLEILNGIIESLIIIADAAKVSNVENDEVLQAMDTMMQKGLKEKVKINVFLNSLDAICNAINCCQRESEENILKEFYKNILEDYGMYTKNKCLLEEFFSNIETNSRDIKSEVDRIKQKERTSEKREGILSQKPKGKFDLNALRTKLPEILKAPKTGKAKLAFTLFVLTIVALGASTVNRHFKAPVVSEKEETPENDNENPAQTETDETYFVDEEIEDDSITYGSSNQPKAEMPENLYKLPIRINTRTNTNWGAHGPKEDTEIVAMADAYGKVYKFIYIDEDGKIQEITNPTQIETYKNYVDTDIEGYVQEYIEGQMEFSLENCVEPSAFKLTSDFQISTKNDETEEEEKFEGDDYEVKQEDEETQEQSSSDTIEQEDNEIEDENQTITLKRGEWILGFVVVENDNIVIRYIDQNGINQDIPISYVDNSSLPYDHEWQIENELFKDSINVQATEDIPLFNDIQSDFKGVIKAGQKFQIDFKDEGKKCVAKLNGCILGYLDEVPLREQIEELGNKLADKDYINGLVDENIPINPVNDEYYNGIKIPKQLENEQIAAFIMDNYNSEKMPNTKFNENHGTIIEIDASQDINYILKRIETLVRITGMPYGLEVDLKDKEDIDTLTKYLEKIQKGKYSDYFQYGVIIDTPIENDQYYYDTYYGVTMEDTKYTEAINCIKTAYSQFKEKGLNPSVLIDLDSKINIESLDPKEIPTITLMSNINGAEYSKETQEFYDELVKKGYQISGVFDQDSYRISLDDEIVNKGTKNVAERVIQQPDIEIYEESPYFEESSYDESYNSTQEEGEAMVGNVQDEEIEFY